MTDYTKSTNFTAKDSLPPGDSGKIVRGSEFDTEFSAVQTAVNSKADKSSPTFTGTLTASGMTVTGAFTLGATALTVTAAELNILDGVTATTAELNILDGVTATTAELNFVDGVTENIQTQLNGKQPTGSYLTGNQTITLSGDATGSGTTSIVVVVADDSHNHSNSTVTSLDAAKVTTGTFADARISQTSVTQHQAAINAGQVDGKSVSVVAALPGSPDANTIYFVTG